MSKQAIKAPFPYFGGKSRIAAKVWQRLGDCQNYVEPFFGSGAVLLSRPHRPRIETVNDADGLLCNFWRAIKAAPDAVAEYADWPVNENDLHARHFWLVERKDSLQARLEGDPEFYDAKVAGWWVWGICCWLRGVWCSGRGSQTVRNIEGIRQMVPRGEDSDCLAVCHSRPDLTSFRGVIGTGRNLSSWFNILAKRLRRVLVCCGDWSRICTPTIVTHRGLTAVFLDPPYADTAKRNNNLYRIDSLSVAHEVRKWALENGDNPLMRIALCGYVGEHVMPDSWECLKWKTSGGLENMGTIRKGNYLKECIWFSPHCLKAHYRHPRALFEV